MFRLDPRLRCAGSSNVCTKFAERERTPGDFSHGRLKTTGPCEKRIASFLTNGEPLSSRAAPTLPRDANASSQINWAMLPEFPAPSHAEAMPIKKNHKCTLIKTCYRAIEPKAEKPNVCARARRERKLSCDFFF